VTPPAPDVPTALARFIGVWEGTWDTGLVTRVGFEQISTDRAVGIYAYPTQPGFQGTTIQAGWQRFAGQINGDSVVWNASGFTAIFKPSADAGSLLGERQITNPNLISRASLSRCSPG